MSHFCLGRYVVQRPAGSRRMGPTYAASGHILRRRRKSGSHQTHRWREPDSNHRSRGRKSGRCQVSAIRPGSVEHLLWEEVLSLSGGQRRRTLGLAKDNRTSPYDLCANCSDRRQSRVWDRWFESTPLQRGVRCELALTRSDCAQAHPAFLHSLRSVRVYPIALGRNLCWKIGPARVRWRKRCSTDA